MDKCTRRDAARQGGIPRPWFKGLRPAVVCCALHTMPVRRRLQRRARGGSPRSRARVRCRARAACGERCAPIFHRRQNSPRHTTNDETPRWFCRGTGGGAAAPAARSRYVGVRARRCHQSMRRTPPNNHRRSHRAGDPEAPVLVCPRSLQPWTDRENKKLRELVDIHGPPARRPACLPEVGGESA